MFCLLRYVRALGALYMRLTGSSIDCYKYLEPLYLDYRKVKRQTVDGCKIFFHLSQYSGITHSHTMTPFDPPGKQAF